MSKVRLLAAVALLAFGLAAQAGTRVQSTDLTYLGVINITEADGSCGNTPNARALGLTFNPSGNGGAGSFYITGRRDGHCIGEITRPAVGGTATFIQSYSSDVSNGTWDDHPGGAGSGGTCENGCFIGGHMLHGGNLYFSIFGYYDGNEAQTQSLYRHNTTLTNHTGLAGPMTIGNGAYPRQKNGYMDNVPAAYQSILGNTAVIGGCCWSVIGGTSLGPALFSFDPDNPTATAYALVQYPDGHRTLNAWETPSNHPEANPATKIGGVTFIEGTDTVMFVGGTGNGNYCYGTVPPCSDPLSSDHGVHFDAYSIYVWLYDVDDMAAAKAGAVNPWDVMPYSHFALSPSEIGGYGDEMPILGVAFDQITNRLYILRNRQGDGDPSPEIRVFSVSTGGSGLLPGPANFRRVPQ